MRGDETALDERRLVATLEYELNNGHAAVLSLEDGTELFAARVNLERSVLDSSHDFAAIAWDDETKRAFAAGEINTRGVFWRKPGRQEERLFQVCFVPGAIWKEFSVRECSWADSPSMDWTADYLGYTGVDPGDEFTAETGSLAP